MDEKKPTAPIGDDKKATEHLANERTFLAWIRTSIAIISLGFVVAKFAVWLRELALRFNPHSDAAGTGASLPIGVTMMALGAVFAALAARRYHRVNRDIENGRVSPDRALIYLVTGVIIVLSVVMIAYMLLTQGQT